MCRPNSRTLLIIRGACLSNKTNRIPFWTRRLPAARMTSLVNLRARNLLSRRSSPNSMSNNSQSPAATTWTCSELSRTRLTSTGLPKMMISTAGSNRISLLSSSSRPSRKNWIILAICSEARLSSRSRRRTRCSTCRRARATSRPCPRRPLAPTSRSSRICLICLDEHLLSLFLDIKSLNFKHLSFSIL